MLAPERKNQFEQLLLPEIYEAAWRYASRLSASRQDAEDLLQDSLVTALGRVHTLRDATCFRGWLMSIIRRRYIDCWRRAKSRVQAGDGLPQLAAPDDSDELSLEIADALNRLPESQRELLVLFYVDGLSLKETGQVLGISARAVRQRLFRARQALRNQLSNCEYPDVQLRQVKSGMHE